MAPLDSDTAETVRNMVRYITDDVRIARHVGCEVRQVVRLRAEVGGGQRHWANVSRAPVPSERGENLALGAERWMRDARQGSRDLARALKRVGAPA